jgi:hypothetical protein
MEGTWHWKQILMKYRSLSAILCFEMKIVVVSPQGCRILPLSRSTFTIIFVQLLLTGKRINRISGADTISKTGGTEKPNE